VGDVRTGKKLYHAEVQGYQKGPVKRHGCPSHGIALTPNEKELRLCCPVLEKRFRLSCQLHTRRVHFRVHRTVESLKSNRLVSVPYP
jgi:hypothetical protein